MTMEARASGLDIAGIAHGFGTRDAPVADGFHLVRVKQVHGADVLEVDESSPSPAGEADALVTASPGVAVAIATADCVPILLAAPESRIVAAVHAGWRGSLAGIVAVVLDELARRGVAPGELRAALGPSIGGCCFEIEREIAEHFVARFGDEVWNFWKDGAPEKGTLDLRSVNELALKEAGVPEESIEKAGPCTFCGGAELASYRRDGAKAGRQLSWIALTA